jgi:hypothetical protein
MTTQTAAQKKKIVKNNAKFKRATAAEKRVMIAKDVIAALEKKTIVSESGTWCTSRKPLFNSEEIKTYFDYVVNQDDVDVDVINNINDTEISRSIKNVKCNVCALGALFVCGVRRFNKITFGELGAFVDVQVNSGPVSGYFKQEHLEYFLKRYFSESQLALIEIAFEQGEGGFIPSVSSQKELLAKDMFKGNAKKRMIGIMKNIIKNNGQFVVARIVKKGPSIK